MEGLQWIIEHPEEFKEAIERSKPQWLPEAIKYESQEICELCYTENPTHVVYNINGKCDCCWGQSFRTHKEIDNDNLC